MILDRYKSKSRISYELLVQHGINLEDINNQFIKHILAEFGHLEKFGEISDFKSFSLDLKSEEVYKLIYECGACLIRKKKWGDYRIASFDEPFKQVTEREVVKAESAADKKTYNGINAIYLNGIRNWNQKVSGWFTSQTEINSTAIRKFYESRENLVLELRSKVPNSNTKYPEEAYDADGGKVRPTGLKLEGKKVQATTLYGLRIADLEFVNCEVRTLRFINCHISRFSLEKCNITKLEMLNCKIDGMFNILACELQLDVLLQECTVASGCEFRDLSFRGSTSFSGCTFSELIDFSGCKFYKSIKFPKVTFDGAVNFNKSFFDSGLSFYSSNFTTMVSFKRCEFNFTPIFLNCVLPNDLVFYKTIFRSVFRLEDLVSFRILRAHFSARKDVRQENDFFVLEQRTLRRLTPTLMMCIILWIRRKLYLVSTDRVEHYTKSIWRENIEDGVAGWFKSYPFRMISLDGIISFIYDYLSCYGQSILRPLALFLMTIPLFSTVYYYSDSVILSAHSKSFFSTIEPAVSFSIQLLFNPTSLVSEKSLVVPSSVFGIIFGAFQVVYEITTLALFLIALKRRFLKGSSE